MMADAYLNGADAHDALADYIERLDVIHMWMVMAPELAESREAFDAATNF